MRFKLHGLRAKKLFPGAQWAGFGSHGTPSIKLQSHCAAAHRGEIDPKCHACIKLSEDVQNWTNKPKDLT